MTVLEAADTSTGGDADAVARSDRRGACDPPGTILPPVSFEETTLHTDRGPMFALRAGSGPGILFLHGVTANAYVWEPVLQRLADRFLVVAVDQRGHGRTGVRGVDPANDATWDAASYANDALSAAGAIAEGPVVLVGHSLGARNALVAAELDPSAIAGVVAIDFTPFIEVAVFDALDARVARGGDPLSDVGAVEDALRQRYPNLPDDAIGRRARFGFRIGDGGWVPLADRQAMVTTCRGLRADLSPTLRATSVPTLLLRGVDSALVSEHAWRATTALRPDIDARQIEGADHYVPEEQPETTARAVSTFALQRASWGAGSNIQSSTRRGTEEPWQNR